jgi:hypothetical protein
VSRRIILSHNDRFVILHYMYYDKYNHSRLYGQSLNLNSYGPNPRVMKAGEHRKDKEGNVLSGLDMAVA